MVPPSVKGGKIIKIGRIDPQSAKKTIDAKAMVVSPGFIDFHTHPDMPVSDDGNAECKVRQGVTLYAVSFLGFCRSVYQGGMARVNRIGTKINASEYKHTTDYQLYMKDRLRIHA
jgi:N-acyl-D-aspartate/D-glutamate deacylase